MNFLFGNLTLNDLPHEWFTIGGTVFISVMGLAVMIFLWRTKRWKWLWNTWLTSTDPKKIGVMYLIVASLMFARGGLDAGMIWLQQSMAAGNSHGYLTADHFQQIFTAHGNIMVFFVTMGFIFGLMNIIIPLQIGARDVASPLLNTLGFWLYVAGAILINMFFVIGGEFSATGWLAVAPLSELHFSPTVGVDYWIMSLQVSGLGTLLGGINFVMTILKMRAPGMTLMKMPVFVWTSLLGMLLVISVFPILSATTALLFLDRFFGMHFFTSDSGGNPMMYSNLIWMWGHPEVYILVIPSFGIYSEVVSTFSQKKLFGYVSMVAAAFGITFISVLVWLHHFFTMGSGADVNAFFGISTMLISIPTGVQVFNWIMTMRHGKIKLTSPMHWFLGFIGTFSFGGMAGLLLAQPAADYQLHNSLFLVAHFHTMIIGGALFGIFAGITYWFPKAFGFKLNERLGKYAFWLWLSGFFTAFVPLYILGVMGATRRLDHYDVSTGWQPLFIVALIGFVIICCGAAMQVLQIVVSIMHRKKNRDVTGDPWNGRTLEWATASPPAVYNFAVIPKVHSRDAFWEMKQSHKTNSKHEARNPKQIQNSKRSEHLQLGHSNIVSNFDIRISDLKYEDIHMPKNTASGIYISAFVFLIGFAFVWHIIWLIIVGFVCALVVFIKRAFEEETEYVISAEEVEKIEEKRHQLT